MYESPIKLTWENFDEVCKKMTLDEENAITRCVRIQANVDVDKVELLRALQYDRGQYEKGYEDGKRDAARRGEWITKEPLPRTYGIPRSMCGRCGAFALYEFINVGSYAEKLSTFCPECGARMDGKESGDGRTDTD